MQVILTLILLGHNYQLMGGNLTKVMYVLTSKSRCYSYPNNGSFDLANRLSH